MASMIAPAEAYSLLDWFHDKSGPLISSGFDTDKIYKGNIDVHFLMTDKETSIAKARVYLDKEDISSQVDFGPSYYKNTVSIDTRSLNDGEHILTIVARDKSKRKNFSKTKISFKTDNTSPILRFVKNNRLYYGKTAVLSFWSNEANVDIEGSFQGKAVKCYPLKTNGRYYRLILGADLSKAPNESYPLHLSISDKAGNITQRRMKVIVYPNRYIVARFRLKPKKARLLSPDIIMADWERVQEILKRERPEKFWVGKFMEPARGVVSLPFGALEYVNGVKRGRHRGLDIANRKGTPIKASNSGIVMLAEYLPAHGNTVIIDHGRGVFSYYSHLHEFKTEVGQRVWKGQVIGTMGSTGIATGSHLHFAVSVHDTRVDPRQWLRGVVAN
ncbi:M23 family metallopeptidase [Candidatus Margulisiibacteriota bacterium]